MQESVHSTAVTQSKWSLVWNTVAYHRLWSFLLVGIGVFSSVIYPHPPFVAFGAIAGTTLKPKPAILVTMSIWLVNQIIWLHSAAVSLVSRFSALGIDAGFGNAHRHSISIASPSV